jgi:hypothetical protein
MAWNSRTFYSERFQRVWLFQRCDGLSVAIGPCNERESIETLRALAPDAIALTVGLAPQSWRLSARWVRVNA